MEYYQLKYYVTVDFYEFIMAEHYTICQAAARCLDESWRQISNSGAEALTVYSTILSRIVCHSARDLSHFQEEMQEMNRLFTPERCAEFSADALEELTDDVDTINRAWRQH